MSEFMICDLLITIKKGNKFLYIFFLLQTQNRGERLLSFVLMFFVFFNISHFFYNTDRKEYIIQIISKIMNYKF